MGRHSSVGIATELRGWTVQGSNPAGGEIFCTCPDRPWAHPASCSMGTGSFPGVKSGRGGTLTPHPLLLPWSRKSTAIPLLPLWAVLPVQSLSACTRVHFTISPYYMKVCVKLHVLTSMSQLDTTLGWPIRQPGYCDKERNPASQDSGWAAPVTSCTEIFQQIIQTVLSQLC